MEPKERIFKRITYYVLLGGLHGFWSLVVTVLAARELFQNFGEQFGMLMIVVGGMLRFNFLDEGLGSYIIRLIARERREPSSQNRTSADFGATILLSLAAAVVIAVLFALALYCFFHSVPRIGLLATLGGAGIIVASFANLGARVLEGCEAYGSLRIVQILLNSLLLAAIFIAVSRHISMIDAVAIYVVFHTLRALLLWLIARGTTPFDLFRSAISGRRPHLQETYRFIRPIVLSRCVSTVSYRLDLWFVHIIVGPIASSAYAVAEAVSNALLQALDIFKVLLPVSIRVWRDSDASWVTNFVSRYTVFILFVICTICLLVLTEIEYIVVTWFGNTSDVAIIALRLQLLFVMLTSMRSLLQVILVGQAKFGELERVFVAAGVINVLLSLTATVGFGGWGPALGTCLAGLFLLVTVIPRAERALSIPTGTIHKQITLPALVAIFTAAWLTTLPFNVFANSLVNQIGRALFVQITFTFVFLVTRRACEKCMTP